MEYTVLLVTILSIKKSLLGWRGSKVVVEAEITPFESETFTTGNCKFGPSKENVSNNG